MGKRPMRTECSARYPAHLVRVADLCVRSREMRLATVLMAITTAALAAAVALAAPSSRTTSDNACGVERWTVKTLQDRPRLLPNRLTTVHYLVTRKAPPSLPDTRLPFEHHVFTVIAAVTLVRPEDDSDLHLVLQEGGSHMIAEAPAPYCDRHAKSRLHKEMAVARRHVRLCSKARVTGVAFFDYDHGQTGVAPNAIELHPILHFRCLRS